MATNWTSIVASALRAIISAIKDNQRTGNQGTGNQGTGNQGTGNRQSGNQGSAPTQKKSTPSSQGKRPTTPQAPSKAPNRSSGQESDVSQDYPGDYHGTVTTQYTPSLDGKPDPGEVVWTWVPFEEDYSQGKDRPVLLIGHDGAWLLALQLTSKDHDRDAAQEARAGRYWMDVGSGPWDNQGRPSEVRLNRILRVNPATVRREGAIMPKKTFNAVIAAMK
ncbi:MAG: type II toxin-antitoxin system PemK/MazF family toxin [Cellulomonadaceae bacterium]|jgi:hypothetical protein|nr:type II toxin-antitoxin system PemK/MazF family toxin [Cellulomonadaceae bacterium]